MNPNETSQLENEKINKKIELKIGSTHPGILSVNSMIRGTMLEIRITNQLLLKPPNMPCGWPNSGRAIGRVEVGHLQGVSL
jgi:hypothetical protein